MLFFRCWVSFVFVFFSISSDARQESRPPQSAIATANAQATDAGFAVLNKGGNAIDAAIAISATLGLVEPESSGLGGGGFFLIHLAKENRDVFIDARERAPLASSKSMYLDEQGQPKSNQTINGALAAAIPGLPAALEHLAKHYGRMPLKQSLAPAVMLAQKGWKFGPKNAAMLSFRQDAVKQNAAAAALFLKQGNTPVVGSVLRNADYAQTLSVLINTGAKGFYEGPLAKKMVRSVRAAGGIWSLEDLRQYRVIERDPIRFRYKEYELVTAPPPSSGGIALAQMFHILEGFAEGEQSQDQNMHLQIEAMRRAYRDRSIYLGDPDFVDIPSALLVSTEYAAGLRASIHPHKATPSDALPGVDFVIEREDTTHFSVMDSEGNYVAATQTVNLPFGNAFVIPGTGFLLNNEMDDFSIKPGVPNAFGLVGDDANAIAPGKRPLSSMSPTFLRSSDRVAVIGTPGGSRIISMVFLGLMHLIEGASAQAAAAAPRFHHQYLPDIVWFEEGAISDQQANALRARGHTLLTQERPWGNMQVVLWDLKNNRVEAGSDPRWQTVGKAQTGKIVFQ